MYHVATDHQRNAETTFLNGNSLQFVDDVDIDDIKNRPDPAGAKLVMQDLRLAVSGMSLRHLSDLFGERHLGEQRIDAPFEVMRLVSLICSAFAHR